MLHHFATFYTYGSDVGHLIYDNFFNNYIDTNKGRFSAAFIFFLQRFNLISDQSHRIRTTDITQPSGKQPQRQPSSRPSQPSWQPSSGPS